MSLENIARSRINQCSDDIRHALHSIRSNNPFAAEQNPERRHRRFQSKLNLSSREAEALNDEVMRRAREAGTDPGDVVALEDIRLAAKEALWGDTVDFVSVAFLEKGAHIARSVGRVAFRSGRAQGTGVLIGSGLFLTNHHVIENPRRASECVLEFDYERDLTGSLRTPTRFAIDSSVFVTDPINGLDFTIFAVGPKLSGPAAIEDYAVTHLSDASDKHMIGEFANIIQHPQGRFKEVVLRENRLVNRFDDALHYVADTEPGSSGSPVYNSEWKLIALHHWGGPWIDGDPDGGAAAFEINEGIRASSIVRKLRHRMGRIAPEARHRLHEALARPDAAPGAGVHAGGQSSCAAAQGTTVRVDETGRATWTLPLEVSVQLPAFTAPQPPPAPLDPAPAVGDTALESPSDLSNRKGYLPDFLPGFHIPLPQLGPGAQVDAARLIDPEPGANPFELKYHHFSVVMNKRRRLAFFTACMIDGKTAKSIRRSDRKVSDLSATDPGLREVVGILDGAEADSWSTDERLDREDYSGDEIYRKQKVPGFPKPLSKGRLARMFQKGHLVRRLDPAWGDETRALEAELDTFFWTNAAPQVGFFNQGTADEDQPGTGKGNLWRSAENYVLRNAVAEDQKVLSFTGPIFKDDDRPYRHIQIPGAFFKVTVWVEGGTLRSLALLVDQSQVFDAWPENIGSAEYLNTASEAEAFMDDKELEKVADFLSTVEQIEALTEIDFGDLVRNADVRHGSPPLEVHSDDDLPFARGPVTGPTAIPGALTEPDGTPDDLREIRGIGPALQRLLNAHGVFHYGQIAAWGDAEIAIVASLLRFPGRIERDDWVGQARALMS